VPLNSIREKMMPKEGTLPNDKNALAKVSSWQKAGCPLPGPEAHAHFMPFGRTSAEKARSGGRVGLDFKEAAVFMGIESDGRVVLIERAPSDGVHSGQMALPGGAREAGESLVECALREWREELGLSPAHNPSTDPVSLTEVHVAPSGFIVRPYLAHVELSESLQFDRTEVAAIHRIRLADLLDEGYSRTQKVRVGGSKGVVLSAPGLSFPGVPFIWGATAMMLGELRAILVSAEG